MKKRSNNQAIAEILGAIFLLTIAVAAFSIIYFNILSNPGPSEETYVTIIGKMESLSDINNTIAFENRRGETLGPDTEIKLTIAGQQQPTKKISDFLYLDGSWKIGGKFFPVKNLGDLTDVQIDATIIDKLSNSIVFYGRLQNGYVVPPFGRGGLWHFNESFWNGTPLEVLDSSGNKNHGTAHNDANTTDDIISPLANRSGAFNLIDYDGYVEVKDHYSLDITDNITIEAWIKPFTDSPGGTIGLLDQFGYTPYITQVFGDRYIFAVVSEDTQHEGNLQTVNLTPHRQLSENSIVDIEYDFGEGNPNQQKMRPIITHIFGNVYVVAFNTIAESRNLEVYLKTFNISANGTIDYTGYAIFDDNESDIGEPNRPSMVKVYDFDTYSIFAIAYSIYVDDGHPSVGVIRTVNISHDGKIKFTGKMANFDDVQGFGQCIIHVGDNVFAIAYRNASNLGVVKTFKISSDGLIEYTGNMFIFDNRTNDDLISSNMIKVSDFGSYGVFAIAYGSYLDQLHPGVGIIKTVNIYYSDGSIVSTGINAIFEESSCIDLSLMHHSENYYIIAYSTGNPPHGNYSAIEITKNGSIIIRSNNVLVLPFQNNQRFEHPMAIKITERGFGIIFESIAGGNGHPGYLMPIEIEYPSDLYSSGIQKLGSYGIYANPNKVFANINTNIINTSITVNSWNYVVLTYDRVQMKLYVNGILRNSASYTEAINITDSNLIFGKLFYGLIDEVAIYDRALSYTEVQDHFKLFVSIIISNVNSSDIGYDSATITWDTNKLSDSIVRYGKTIPPTIIVSDSSWLTSHSITLLGLSSKTTYYFEVQSTSQEGFTVIDNNGGRYYMFTTENRAPNEPRLSNPRNGSKNVEITSILEWIGGDPDGDNVTYNVYLGTVNPPIIKVSENQSEEFYDPIPDLDYYKVYYWQIIAWDNDGASTSGPIWHFTTEKPPH